LKKGTDRYFHSYTKKKRKEQWSRTEETSQNGKNLPFIEANDFTEIYSVGARETLAHTDNISEKIEN
jgi:hypothetical protein